jgi:heptaprenyl diphosphate synthase
LNFKLFETIKDELIIVENEMKKFVQTPNPILTETSSHLLFAGGKRLRPAFAILSSKFHNCSLDKILPLAVALEMVHMASLVHDDVVDASLTRRGKPTVKAKWGDKISLHTGDYILSKALMLISQYKDKRIPNIIAKASVQMCHGEIEQLSSAYKPDHSLCKYFFKIKRKTALLISVSCQLGSIASGAPDSIVKPLTKYGHYLGMAFQITDDILDIISSEEELGKPIGGDIRQGIITLPTIYALKNNSSSSKLAKLLEKKNKTQEQVLDAIEIIKKSGGIDYSFEIAKKYIVKAKNELVKLPAIDSRDTLELIADYIYTRKH